MPIRIITPKIHRLCLCDPIGLLACQKPVRLADNHLPFQKFPGTGLGYGHRGGKVKTFKVYSCMKLFNNITENAIAPEPSDVERYADSEPCRLSGLEERIAH